MQAPKPKPKIKSKLIKAADDVFSYYTRLMDSDENGIIRCITCSKPKYWYKIDNGHFIKRQYYSHRFNEINCNAQCKHCNNWLQGSDVIYSKAIIRKYGQVQYDLLMSKPKHQRKPKEYELKAIIQMYLPQVRELLKAKEHNETIFTNVTKKLDRIERLIK